MVDLDIDYDTIESRIYGEKEIFLEKCLIFR